jgi:hypothetical protein
MRQLLNGNLYITNPFILSGVAISELKTLLASIDGEPRSTFILSLRSDGSQQVFTKLYLKLQERVDWRIAILEDRLIEISFNHDKRKELIGLIDALFAEENEPRDITTEDGKSGLQDDNRLAMSLQVRSKN